MKSPARFPRPARTAAAPVAMNTSPLPASARLAIPAKPATQAPRKRRDAAPRSGYETGVRPVFRNPRQVAAPSETNFGDDKGFSYCFFPAPLFDLTFLV
jgi:hypothetical protein